MNRYLSYALIVLTYFSNTLFSCTGIRLTTQTGSPIYARTMDFPLALNSEILFVPRKYRFIGTNPLGKPKGLGWKSKYAVIGANALNKIGFVDGVNEKGLAGGLFYLPGTIYENIEENDYKNSLAAHELLTWILTRFSTVAEVKDALTNIKVSNAPDTEFGLRHPLHTIIHDESGNCIVIEYHDGQLQITDNFSGAITNLPTLKEHEYLSNYKQVLSQTAALSSINDVTKKLGLPQSYASKHRFIRAAVLSSLAAPAKTERKSVTQALKILGTCFNEMTQWTSVCDIKNRRYHFFSVMGNRIIHLSEFDPHAEDVIRIATQDS